MDDKIVNGTLPGYVYVLGTRTARGAKTYVGWTLDPERRLGQHNAGTGAKSTRGLTWSLLYVERLQSRTAAMSREWHLKRDRRFRGDLAARLRDSTGPLGQALNFSKNCPT